ncbi:hypothetical protein [Mangrovibacterium marinum]|uniref:hypothetical protein n=1 Tax=Mangrovibacterium marinum TaxID=1639118 RepID=UPI002A18E1BE|nr:hypothetical protein [Mangrovibacterium marinum]
MNLSHDRGIEDYVYHIARLELNAYRIQMWDSEVSDTMGKLIDNNHLYQLDYTLKQMKELGFIIVVPPLT